MEVILFFILMVVAIPIISVVFITTLSCIGKIFTFLFSSPNKQTPPKTQAPTIPQTDCSDITKEDVAEKETKGNNIKEQKIQTTTYTKPIASTYIPYKSSSTPIPIKTDLEPTAYKEISYLYHMTHYSNLVGIIKNGILPKNKLPNPVYDISNQDVQQRREKLEYIYNRQIHDYVPFYFNPKNPMLYVRRNIQHEIIILAITKSLLKIEGTIFSDGNAASEHTLFYKGINNLEKLNWGCIKAPYWNDYIDGRRIRCSEALVHNPVMPKFIEVIFCNNERLKTQIETLLKNNHIYHIKVIINRNLYF